jgi:4-amino-4-deoxy-L-arabinose transferase-like glycosyltransferase
VLLALGLIILASILLGGLMLSREHGWGDDFAAYIMQAQSVARGNIDEFVQANTFTVEHSAYWYVPVTYPWGFPLLLAPVVRAFGVKLLALKLVLTLCYALFLFVFFWFGRGRLGDGPALVLTAVLGLNPTLLSAQNEILSDIPFLLFTTLALWLIDRSGDEAAVPTLRGSIATGCAMFLAAFVRAQGLVLVVPLAATQLMHLRDRARQHANPGRQRLLPAVPYAILALLYGLQAALLPSSAYELLGIYSSATLESTWANIRYYFWLPADMFKYLPAGADIVHLVVLAGFLFNLVRWRGRDIPLHLFCAALLAPYVLMPAVQGMRYIYPLLPVLLIFSFGGMQRIADLITIREPQVGLRLITGLWCALALLSLAADAQLASANLASGRYPHDRSDGAFSPGTDLMFEFIREQTPADSVIVFFRPRAMRLRTDRDAFMTTDCRDLPKADYVVLTKNNRDMDQIPLRELLNCEPAVLTPAVYEKDEFAVFQIAGTR